MKNMRKIKAGLILMTIISISALSCNLTRNLPLYIAGLQNQVDSLTNVANPVGISTFDANITPTLVPTTQIEATPTQAVSPTGEASQIIGYWSGTMQWLCDDSPPMATTMDFKLTGNVTIVFTFQGQDPVVYKSTWTVNAGTISISDVYGYITGTVSGNTMTGSFEENDENFNCHGTWTVTRQ